MLKTGVYFINLYFVYNQQIKYGNQEKQKMNTNVLIVADAAGNAQVADAVNTAKEVTATAAQQAPSAVPGEPAQKPGFLESIGPMVPMILIIVVMFYLMYRGQKKEQKRRQDMITSIKKGDSIVTIGGLHATVSEIRDDSFKVKIAENTEITIAKSAIASVAAPDAK